MILIFLSLVPQLRRAGPLRLQRLVLTVLYDREHLMVAPRVVQLLLLLVIQENALPLIILLLEDTHHAVLQVSLFKSIEMLGVVS